MRDDTPYTERPATEVAREQACMREIFQQAPEVGVVWEAFAGMGVTAEVLRERYPNAIIRATDLDEECVNLYNIKNYGRATKADALVWAQENLPHIIHKFGVSLDYNKFTLFDLRETRSPSERWKLGLIRQVLSQGPEWVQLTDSACRYLHLNWGNYDLAANDFNLYVRQLAREVALQPGGEHYRHAAWSKHHAASYHLFVRQ